MEIAEVRCKETTLDVIWADGTADEFHYIWLRDHILAEDNFDPITGERRVDFHSLPPAPRPLAAEPDESGALRLTWKDDQRTCLYPADWLRANSYSRLARQQREAIIPAARPWDFTSRTQAPSFDYERARRSAEGELEFLCAFRAYGFAFLTGAPAAGGVVERLTEELGYLRPVAFGSVREIKSGPAYDNVAFSSHDVHPHLDAANYIWPYDVQFMHCIDNSAQGGDSYIVDGIALAERLRAEAPNDFAVLSEVKVGYRIGAKSHDLRHAAPVIELDRTSQVRFLRFSNAQRRVLSVPHDQVEPFYRAYRRLSAMVNDPANQLAYRFAPGEVMMFNNHRILHARTAFDPASGNRHLQLATTDLDMVDSRIRVLTLGLASAISK